MNQKMSTSEKFGALLNDVCDGTVTETQIQELEVILESDVTARKAFADHFQLLTDIRFLGQVERARNVGLAGVRATLPQTTQSSSPTLPQVFLTNIIHGPVGFYSGWPVAYLIATVIFGIGALIGSVTYVSHPGQIAERLPVVITGKLASEPQMEFVGRITGMVDCQWADASTEAVNGAYVPLGRKYALSSGLMEITYDTGAKVIVQGPVTYEVESAFGGYLAVGKLTARVDKKEDHRSTSKSPNPTLFTIKTPTATVTDLGTEFGVEVDESGTTQSHVFRGLVRVQRLADGGKPEETGQLLRENESARVERSGQGRIVVVPAAKSAGFVREIPKLKIKTLDLVDVVAGGDGFSGRRGRGIDPTSGRTTDTPPNGYMTGDGKYHRVEELPFVDGVFIPDVGSDQVQIDSAGNTFGLFGNANNLTSIHVWAGGVIPTNPPNFIRTEIAGVDYASPGHGLLFMHANKGITFDMDTIRRANPGGRLLRFRATAGNTETIYAKGTTAHGDLWVFVDGQPRFKRRYINSFSGAIPINTPINDNDRFLTLAATDGGHAIEYSWITLGDPRLELRTTTLEDINRDPSSQSP